MIHCLNWQRFTAVPYPLELETSRSSSPGFLGYDSLFCSRPGCAKCSHRVYSVSLPFPWSRLLMLLSSFGFVECAGAQSWTSLHQHEIGTFLCKQLCSPIARPSLWIPLRWSGHGVGFLYFFPSVQLLLRYLARLESCQGRVVLLTPWWLARLWFQALIAR